MKHLIASLAASTFLFVVAADNWTNTTQRYITGQLEPRLIELGTNKQSGEYFPQWRLRQESGIKLHCSRVLHAQGSFNDLCGRSTSQRLK